MTAWGVVKATLIAAAILLFINNIVIPYTVAAGASWTAGSSTGSDCRSTADC